MLKWDLESITNRMLGGAIFGGLLFFATMIAIFRTFPAHPWPFVFAMLWFAEALLFAQRAAELRAINTERRQGRDMLTLRFGLLAAHRGEHEQYDWEPNFWTEMQKQSAADIEYADGLKETGAELDGTTKPRAIFTFLGTLASQGILVVIAWFVARLWP